MGPAKAAARSLPGKENAAPAADSNRNLTIQPKLRPAGSTRFAPSGTSAPNSKEFPIQMLIVSREPRKQASFHDFKLEFHDFAAHEVAQVILPKAAIAREPVHQEL